MKNKLFSKNGNIECSFVERAADKVLRKYFILHLLNTSEYSNKKFNELEDELTQSLLAFVDHSFFIGNNHLHDQYVKELNKNLYKIPKEYIKNKAVFKEKYSLEDWDLFNIINDASIPGKEKELDPDLKSKAKKIKKLYKIAKSNLLLPLVDKKSGKKTLGIIAPTLEMIHFQYSETVFISPEIINSYISTQGFDIFEVSSINKTAKDYAELLLTKMIEDGMSDLEYFVYDEYFYQIDGERESVKNTFTRNMPIKTGESITEAFLAMVNMRNSTSKIIKRKLSFRYKHKDYHFRISMIRQSKTKQKGLRRNRAVAIRLLSDIAHLKGYKDSNLYPEVVELIKAGCKSGGMFLWVGETGSGKSTSLYRDLYNLWEDGASKLITIDNPLEYDIDGATQYDITDTAETDDPMTIDKVVSAILQQNPDYCSIGEIKSDEEYRSFVKLGLRGHTTGGTLHANNTKSAIKLIVDMGGVPKDMLTPNISFIAHQDLVPMLCQECFGRGKCATCDNDGVSGVIPVVEFAYFKGLKEGDDIYDYDSLLTKKKMIYIPKEEYAKRLYLDKKISEEIYNDLFLEYADVIPESLMKRALSFKEKIK